MSWKDFFYIKYESDVQYIGEQWYVVKRSNDKKLAGCVSQERAIWKAEEYYRVIQDMVDEVILETR